MIVSKGRPDYKNPGAMSAELKDFIEKCTIMEPSERPTMEDLIQVRRVSGGNVVAAAALSRTR